MIKITNSSFNLTDGILRSADPSNIHLENIFMDFGSMDYGLYNHILWNYPEASKTGTIYVNNISIVHSLERKVHEETTFITQSSPYNYSVTNLDILGKFLV